MMRKELKKTMNDMQVIQMMKSGLVNILQKNGVSVVDMSGCYPVVNGHAMDINVIVPVKDNRSGKFQIHIFAGEIGCSIDIRYSLSRMIVDSHESLGIMSTEYFIRPTERNITKKLMTDIHEGSQIIYQNLVPFIRYPSNWKLWMNRFLTFLRYHF